MNISTVYDSVLQLLFVSQDKNIQTTLYISCLLFVIIALTPIENCLYALASLKNYSYVQEQLQANTDREALTVMWLQS